MTQHTPGPWTPHEKGVHPYPFVCGPAEPTEHGEESFLVAYVTGIDAEANANLIAAAPDMLSALRAVNKLISDAALTGFNCHDGDWADRLFESQRATSAAIKRAFGSAAPSVTLTGDNS